jgi:hypothetical protein
VAYPFTPPVAPDKEFARRYADTYTYGFYVQTPNETVDQITDSYAADRWATLNLNPQQITMREPFATSVTVTQGGGKVVESRGGVLKSLQISGTTGYLPTPDGTRVIFTKPLTAFRQRGALVDLSLAAEEERAQRSGFYAFYRLRHLFRSYQYEKRRGRTDLTMHYMDFKGDDYWRIEPQEFTLSRSSRKPFSYDYQLSAQLLEPSAGPSQRPDPIRNQTLFVPLGLSDDFRDVSILGAIRRLEELAHAGAGFIRHLSSSIKLSFQEVLRNVTDVVSVFEDVHSAFATLAQTPLNLLKQLDSAVGGMFEVVSSLTPDSPAGAIAQLLTGATLAELNEWLLEAKMTGAHIASYVIRNHADRPNRSVLQEDDKFSRSRARQGSVSSLMVEPEGSTGSPDANPFIGRSGLDLVTDVDKLVNLRSVEVVPIQTGDTIFSLAQRTLGDPQRFVDLVLINQLVAPYIVPDKKNKPSGTLAWNEFIQVPAASIASRSGPDQRTAPVPTYASTVTQTGLTDELVDEMQSDPWRVDQWIGYTVTLTKPSGVVQTRVVVFNTETILSVNYPWDDPPDVDDAYSITLDLFSLRQPTSEEGRVFGTDLLVVFSRKNGRPHQEMTADIALNGRGDLAKVSGIENWAQSIRLRAHCEQGRHPFHPGYGLALPVGRPFNTDVVLLFLFLARQSLLSDPRTAEVRHPRIDMTGDTVAFSVEAQPVRIKAVRAFQFTR